MSELARRKFLAGVGTGIGVLGAAAVGAQESVAQTAAPFAPGLHEQDAWMELPGKHRFVFDTTSPDGLGTGLQFAGNFFEANKTGYGLSDNDLAVIMVVRHKSTSFAFNDTIWAKYSTELAKTTAFVDPRTKTDPVVNVYGTPGNGTDRPGRMDGLIKRGMHLAVCQMATRAIAGTLARSTGATQDDVFKELAANMVANAHLAPAGIVAVNRAQERGFALCHAG